MTWVLTIPVTCNECNTSWHLDIWMSRGSVMVDWVNGVESAMYDHKKHHCRGEAQ